MDFYQKKDGSCTLEFTDTEKEIIAKQGKFIFTPTALRHFGNKLMNMVVEWNRRLPDDVKGIETIPMAETEKKAWAKPQDTNHIKEDEPIK